MTLDSSNPGLGSIKESETSILIVEDNLQYSQVLKRLLQGTFGYNNITTVEDTNRAYELIEKQPEKFRLLFVDYHFPSGETGGLLLEKLRDAKLLDDKIAFLITSEPTMENMKQAHEAGAIGVVAKPFNREAIRDQLELAERAVIAANTESF